MGKGRRNRDKKSKDKHVNDKSKTAVSSSNNTIKVKIDEKKVTTGDHKSSDGIQVDSNRQNVQTKLTDEKEERKKYLVSIKAVKGCLHPQTCVMSKEMIDEIENSVTTFRSRNRRLETEILSSKKYLNVSVSLLEIYPGLDQFLKMRHQDLFINSKKDIILNVEAIEKLWDIFYVTSKVTNFYFKQKLFPVQTALNAIQNAKIAKEEAGTNKKTMNSQNDKIFVGDILKSTHLLQKEILNECKKEDKDGHFVGDILKSTHLLQKEILKEYKKEDKDGYLRTCKDKEPELRFTEKKADITFSNKEPISTVAKSESHEKTSDTVNHADKNIEVVDPSESDDERKGKVVKLTKNDNIHFQFESDDNMHISAGTDKYSYTLEEKKDIAFNFIDENIQILFTGNQIFVKTPNSEFDILIRKSDPVHLNNEVAQTDALL